ncbi:MAG: DNA primase [Planctomycetota bacterium]
MAGRITSQSLERVKDATDIVDVVSGYVTLKRSGRNHMGLCPFHDEKTPSFSVTPDRGWFNCFGCGEKGSAIDFVMAMDRMSFVEAVEVLAERAGIVLEREENAAPKDPNESPKNDIFRANKWAAEFFKRKLLAEGGETCREYLRGRGLSEATWEEFCIGYAPEGWTEMAVSAERKGINERLLIDAGLAKKREGKSGVYDAFRHRLMFPIFDALERVIGFGGRSLDGSEPKYLNSPKTPVFNKSACLYGLDRLRRLRKGEEIFVMEGYTDVIMGVQQASIPAVATLGTALTPQHAKLLSRYTDRITLVYDGDSAGRKAAERGAELFTAVDLELKVARLAGGQDPCDFLSEKGEEGVEIIRSGAMPFFEFVLGEVSERHDLRDVTGKVKAADELLRLARAAANPIKRGLILDRISESLGLARGDLESRLTATQPRTKASTGTAEEPRRKVPVFEEPDRVVTKATSRAERHFFQAIINGAGLGIPWSNKLQAIDFSTVRSRRLFDLLVEQHAGPSQPDPEQILLTIEDPSDRQLVKDLVQFEVDNELLQVQLEGAIKHLLECRHERELKALQADGVTEDNFAAIVRKMRETQSSAEGPAPVVSKPESPRFEAPTTKKQPPKTPRIAETPWNEDDYESSGFDDEDMF